MLMQGATEQRQLLFLPTCLAATAGSRQSGGWSRSRGRKHEAPRLHRQAPSNSNRNPTMHLAPAGLRTSLEQQARTVGAAADLCRVPALASGALVCLVVQAVHVVGQAADVWEPGRRGTAQEQGEGAR